MASRSGGLLRTIDRLYPTLSVSARVYPEFGYEYATIRQLDKNPIPHDVIRHIVWMAMNETDWFVSEMPWTMESPEDMAVWQLNLVRLSRRECGGIKTA